jgi:hypothetical protein
MRSFTWVLTFLLLAAGAPGQAGRGGQGRRFTGPEPEIPPTSSEFTFVRTVYSSPLRGFGRRGGSWATDFPQADYHFIAGIRFWSGANLDISPKPAQIRIMDERLLDYPLIYFVEPGFLELSDEEALKLREYVSRGGFLFLDDFWGDYEWENVQRQLRKVFPQWAPVDLPLAHPLFHCYFDIDSVIQVPGIGAWMSGSTYEKGGIVPHYMGIQNDRDRVVAFIARNCDLGDAWEWIDDPQYPLKYGLAAYRLGINVITYAMTH